MQFWYIFKLYNFKNKIYFSMFRRVSSPDVLNNVKEPDHIADQRAKYNDRLKILKKSKDLLTRDVHLSGH